MEGGLPMKQWKSLPIAVSMVLALTLAAKSASTAQDSPNANDGISARLIAGELQALGYPATIDKDGGGDPLVTTTVDGFRWSIVFYDCGTGALEQRNCDSIQFYTGYSVPNGFPVATTNKWDTEKRYARAYTYVQRDKTTNARIEIDVLIAGTGADPAKTFRAYFTKMKNSAEGFRTLIGCSAHCTQTRSDGVAN